MTWSDYKVVCCSKVPRLPVFSAFRSAYCRDAFLRLLRVFGDFLGFRVLSLFRVERGNCNVVLS